MFEQLHVTVNGPIVWLELNHGKTNEMGSAQLREFEHLVELLEAPGPAALITYSRKESSRGTPLFVAGADVTERVGWDDARVKQHVRWQRAVLGSLRRAPVLHIGVVSGVALGWGTEYLLTCDYRIATPKAVFGLPETGLGIVPGAGGTSELWAQIGPAQALRLGMTGERIDAVEAQRIGLVQELADSLEGGLERAKALASMASTRSPTSLAQFKRGLLRSIGAPASERTEIEAAAYATCVDHGEAAIGRANFQAIRKGEPVPWGPKES